MKLQEDEIEDERMKYLVQVAGIIQIVEEDDTTMLCLLALHLVMCTVSEQPKNASKTPFYHYKYEQNVSGTVHKQLLSVDFLKCPTFLVPESCTNADTIESSISDIFKIRFLHIDYFFFDRAPHNDIGEYLQEKFIVYKKSEKRCIRLLLEIPVFHKKKQKIFFEKMLPKFLTKHFIYNEKCEASRDAIQNNILRHCDQETDISVSEEDN